MDIDIRPYSRRNIIKLESDDDECEAGKLRVALLGSQGFDVRDVDVSTLTLGDPNLAETVPPMRSRLWRVNRDRYKDLLLDFSICELLTNGALDEGSVELVLTGQMYDHISILGIDSVRVLKEDDDGDDIRHRPWRRWGRDDDD